MNDFKSSRWNGIRRDEDLDAMIGDMDKYPQLSYSMKKVRKAGGRLAGQILYTDDDVREVFSVANSWRNSHFYPMRSVYFCVAHRLRKAEIAGDLASRAKRMPSIRRKLNETTVKLDQMNDIGGCRAILDDIEGVHRLTKMIRESFPHKLRQEWHYIEQPKDDGYRSHHLVFEFAPRNRSQEAIAGRRVELQLRTRLQHSWATAVEAVGLFNNEDLKHHKGSDEWLRLFRLVSAEFAHVEGCPIGPGLPNRNDRIKEIKELNKNLKAVPALENIMAATNYVENFQFDHGKYFLIHYKPDHTVEVESFYEPLQITARYDYLEKEAHENGGRSKVVIVEVSRIEKLTKIYPNYFGDVSLFVNNLKRICKGNDAVEYAMAPQKRVKPKPSENPDPGWLRRRYTRWE